MSIQSIRRIGRLADVAGTAMLTAASLVVAAAMFAV
jgi:hypothetical protein